MKKLSYRLPFYISILLYLSSLGLTAFTTGESEIPGIYCLLGGWFVFLNDIPSFIAWLANITFFIALFSVVKRKKAPKLRRGLILSIITLIFGLVAFSIGSVVTEISSESMRDASLGLGYYVWMLSFLLLLVSMIIRIKQKKEINNNIEK